MGKIHSCFFVWIFILIACNNNKTKDPIAAADSANKAKLDSGLNTNAVVIDEASTGFMVEIADLVSAEKEITAYVMHSATNPVMKEFAATVSREISIIYDSVQVMRIQKNITLPSRLSIERQQLVDDIKKLRGEKINEPFKSYIVKTHEEAEKIFNEALLNVKDPQIKSFADLSSMIFKKYLSQARQL
jgi:putative membrane protein